MLRGILVQQISFVYISLVFLRAYIPEAFLCISYTHQHHIPIMVSKRFLWIESKIEAEAEARSEPEWEAEQCPFSANSRVISAEDKRGCPIHCHIKPVPPTHNTSKVGWSPNQPADKPSMWYAFVVLPTQYLQVTPKNNSNYFVKTRQK